MIAPGCADAPPYGQVSTRFAATSDGDACRRAHGRTQVRQHGSPRSTNGQFFKTVCLRPDGQRWDTGRPTPRRQYPGSGRVSSHAGFSARQNTLSVERASDPLMRCGANRLPHLGLNQPTMCRALEAGNNRVRGGGGPPRGGSGSQVCQITSMKESVAPGHGRVSYPWGTQRLILGLTKRDIEKRARIHGGTTHKHGKKQVRPVGNSGPPHAAKWVAGRNSPFPLGDRGGEVAEMGVEGGDPVCMDDADRNTTQPLTLDAADPARGGRANNGTSGRGKINSIVQARWRVWPDGTPPAKRRRDAGRLHRRLQTKGLRLNRTRHDRQ
jgi:hypothetical protein